MQAKLQMEGWKYDDLRYCVGCCWAKLTWSQFPQRETKEETEIYLVCTEVTGRGKGHWIVNYIKGNSKLVQILFCHLIVLTFLWVFYIEALKCQIFGWDRLKHWYAVHFTAPLKASTMFGWGWKDRSKTTAKQEELSEAESFKINLDKDLCFELNLHLFLLKKSLQTCPLSQQCSETKLIWMCLWQKI